MKKYTIFLASLFLVLCSCEKNDDPNQSQITENNIQAVLDSVIAQTHVPGLVAGIWAPNEGIEFVYAAGFADLEKQTPMSADMIFRIASNTKTITITALLQLVDEGLISLEDPLSDYLPDFPRANEVSIEMLTNMQSGIFSFTESEAYVNRVEAEPTRTWTTDELIEIAASQPYYFEPGTGFHYSNSNTAIIGKIIELVTSSSLEYNIRTRVFDPLNLINTAYLVGGTQIPGIHSCAYYAGEFDPNLPDISEYLDISYAGAAGAAISDVYELKTYVKALVGGQYLSPDLQMARLDCHEMGHPMGVKYGMGIMSYKGFYGHNGATYGYTSLMVHSLERNCTIVIWYNSYLPEKPNDLLFVIPQIIYPDL